MTQQLRTTLVELVCFLNSWYLRAEWKYGKDIYFLMRETDKINMPHLYHHVLRRSCV